MESTLKRKLAVATVAYWVLLLYIVAALIWWFISLEKQNQDMSHLKTSMARQSIDSVSAPVTYHRALAQITEEERRNSWKYIGEGTTFLALILVGAVFVYRAVKRQLKMQQQQQNLMMAITHELKTPIAVAKLNLETLEKYQLEEQKKKKMLHMTLSEMNRLTVLTNNILVSSQLERGRYRNVNEELDLSELVKNSVQQFSLRFPQRSWIMDIEMEVDLSGDTLLLQILVNNLLENAEKYSPRDQPITCRLHRDGHHIRLEVLDQGPGIPDIEKKRVFEKFYRMGDESTRTAKGTGLGLYLCKKIAGHHGAQISVLDNRPTGCNFVVDFKV